MAFVGDHCADARPHIVLSTTALVETRCEGGLDENDTFHAKGTDVDGGQIDVTFEFSERSAFCRHGKGVLRLTAGDRTVIADGASCSALD